MSPYKMIGAFIALLSVIGVASAPEMRWALGTSLGAINALVWIWPRYSRWTKNRGKLRVEGQRHLAAGNFAEAEQTLVAAAQQMLSRRGVNPSEHIGLLCEIGTAQLRLNKLSEASTTIRAALDQASGADRGKVLTLQAELLRTQGDFAGSITALKESLDIEKKANPQTANSPEIARRTLALATTAAEAGAEEAVTLFQEAAKLHEAAFGAAHALTAEALALAGKALLKSGDSSAAISMLQRAETVFAAGDSAATPAAVAALHDLARAYSLAERPYDAVEAFELLLSRIDRVAGMPPGEIATARLSAGRAYLAAARYGPALEAIDQALQYFDNAQHALLPSALEARGAALEKFSRYPEAEAALERAIALWEQSGGLNNPQARTAVQRLAALLRYRKQEGAAADLEQRAAARIANA